MVADIYWKDRPAMFILEQIFQYFNSRSNFQLTFACVVETFTCWLQYKEGEAPRDEVLSLEDNVFVPVMETIDTTLFEKNYMS